MSDDDIGRWEDDGGPPDPPEAAEFAAWAVLYQSGYFRPGQLPWIRAFLAEPEQTP